MKKNHQGFSLVELMISIVLGIILMTGVIQMFLSSRSAFSSQQAISRVQETGRLAIEFLSKDVRMAGYLGCASKRKENNVSRLNSANTFANDWLNSIQGYHVTNATGGGVPAGSGLAPVPLKDTDLFVIRGAFSISTVTTADNTDTLLKGAVISAQAGGCGLGGKINGFCSGDVVAETDCTGATVFQISSLNNNGGVMEVAHAATSSPGNQVVTWGGPTPSSVPPDHKYLVGSEIFKLSRIVYFIGTGASGRPSLYQNIDGINTELLEGVEDMSITYGTATSIDDDAPPDLYRDAAAITAAGDWKKVLSMRIQLLIQSAEDGVVAEKQTYTFDTDINKVAPDRRLRQVFVSTVGIRSRVQ